MTGPADDRARRAWAYLARVVEGPHPALNRMLGEGLVGSPWGMSTLGRARSELFLPILLQRVGGHCRGGRRAELRSLFCSGA